MSLCLVKISEERLLLEGLGLYWVILETVQSEHSSGLGSIRKREQFDE